jgi:phosphohistidine phosphatase
MKTLYLLRHAHTLSAIPPLLSDHERILSPQGAEEALQVGKFMQAHEFYPDFVLSSSAVRTIQTTRLIFGVLFSKAGVKVASHFDRRLYHASADTMLAEIRKTDNSIRNLLVVAHNPGIAELALRLGEIDHYAPATLAIFKADCQSWADFLPHTARLEQVFVPHAATI